VSPLLIGGEDLGRKYRNNIGRGSTPFVFSELGSYGNIGMLVFLMGCLQICSRLSRLSGMNHSYGGSLGPRVWLPCTQEG